MKYNFLQTIKYLVSRWWLKKIKSAPSGKPGTETQGRSPAELVGNNVIMIGNFLPVPDKSGITRLGAGNLWVDFDTAPEAWPRRIIISRPCSKDELMAAFSESAGLLWDARNDFKYSVAVEEKVTIQ